MFSISVEPIGDTTFEFNDLRLSHRDCGGGSLLYGHAGGSGWIMLRCNRCRGEIKVFTGTEGTAKIIMTSLDGEPRNHISDNEGWSWNAVRSDSDVPK